VPYGRKDAENGTNTPNIANLPLTMIKRYKHTVIYCKDKVNTKYCKTLVSHCPKISQLIFAR